MLNINITGDFSIQDIDGFVFGSGIDNLLKKSDINVTNMEGPVSDPKEKPSIKSGPNISQDVNVPSLLENHGFNVITLANNHIMDYGEPGLQKTIESFKKSVVVGAGRFEEAYQIKRVKIRGLYVGFLSIMQYEFGVLDDIVYSKGKMGSAWMCHPLVDELIAKGKTDCDYVFILPHAGLEMFSLPLPEIRTLYRHFIDMGADGVFACHPHVPQCWEQYKGKTIMYSLGNFCFDDFEGFSSYGLLAHIEIDNNIKVNPILTCYNQEKKRVDLSEDEETISILNKLNSIFRNKNEYLAAVDAKCLSLKDTYTMLYEMGGQFSHPTIRKSMGIIKRKLLKRESHYNEAHFINNIRCETHRWVQSRIYELTNK